MNPEILLPAAILGGLAGGLAVLFIALRLPERKCPECEEVLPRFRKPATLKQALWGGWTCPRCGSETDRQGRLISAK